MTTEMAPPHTRGSTLGAVERQWLPAGSPAHAGIDPSSPPRASPRTRLPRTRGDRPSAPPSSPQRPRAPPHTRGSTHQPREGRRVALGSPAHAGIDPTATPLAVRRSGLPRTRGDRPVVLAATAGMIAAPPHTRGSTPRWSAADLHARGSPAHAGIDPPPPSTPCAPPWLPRTRGDRPAATTAAMGLTEAPPHTRGSTLSEHGGAAGRRGSPAHAGIDPPASRAAPTTSGLPRTRGDRPVRRPFMVLSTPAPPHTRGSTRAHDRRQRLPHGSPAHAGIDPTQRPATRRSGWLPRTRGDRPASTGWAAIHPAAPPHTRGSTRAHDRRRGLPHGSPAHAGIDPAPTTGGEGR